MSRNLALSIIFVGGIHLGSQKSAPSPVTFPLKAPPRSPAQYGKRRGLPTEPRSALGPWSAGGEARGVGAERPREPEAEGRGLRATPATAALRSAVCPEGQCTQAAGGARRGRAAPPRGRGWVKPCSGPGCCPCIPAPGLQSRRRPAAPCRRTYAHVWLTPCVLTPFGVGVVAPAPAPQPAPRGSAPPAFVPALRRPEGLAQHKLLGWAKGSRNLFLPHLLFKLAGSMA